MTHATRHVVVVGQVLDDGLSAAGASVDQQLAAGYGGVGWTDDVRRERFASELVSASEIGIMSPDLPVPGSKRVASRFPFPSIVRSSRQVLNLGYLAHRTHARS